MKLAYHSDTYRLGRLRSKDGNLLVANVCKLNELLLPLLSGDAGDSGRVSAINIMKTSYGTYDEVQRTSTLFLIVQAAVIPTRVLPAPQGSTIIPDRARLRDNVSIMIYALPPRLTHYQTSY